MGSDFIEEEKRGMNKGAVICHGILPRMRRRRRNVSSISRLALAALVSIFVTFSLYISLQFDKRNVNEVGSIRYAASLDRRGSTTPKRHSARMKQPRKTNSNQTNTTGVFILGMHRSGTSLLTGLLVEGFGFKAGGPLLLPQEENSKGYYERRDLVLENMALLKHQGATWDRNVARYRHDSSVTMGLTGKRALDFMSDSKNTPWMIKDPRLCITLPTWLSQLKATSTRPAILLTYRSPLEVAQSLKNRNSSKSLESALRLWLIYNQRSIENSRGLCRIRTSNDAILSNALQESQRIVQELVETCHVSPPPKKISSDVVNTFVDTSLQHYNIEKNDILLNYDGCIINNYKSEAPILKRRTEMEMYKIAMKVYCDLQSGKAYRSDYSWPKL